MQEQTLLPCSLELLSQSTKLVLDHDLELHGSNIANKLTNLFKCKDTMDMQIACKSSH